MRRIVRADLKAKESRYLRRRQSHADEKDVVGSLDVDSHWSASTQTKIMGTVRSLLKSMAGTLESCMYCSHNHGTDIDHFWPKSLFHGRLYDWDNFLLCCAECGRIKGVKFPLSPAGQPLLLNPTRIDPWEHLDFDPDTGVISARYLLSPEGFSEMGEKTVDVLELDRREALNRAYQMAYRRVVASISEYVSSSRDSLSQIALREALRNVSSHGILGWVLSRSTESLSPFKELRLDSQGWDILQSVDVA